MGWAAPSKPQTGLVASLQIQQQDSALYPVILLCEIAKAYQIVMRSSLPIRSRGSGIDIACDQAGTCRSQITCQIISWMGLAMRSADRITWAGKLTAISQQGGARSHPDRSLLAVARAVQHHGRVWTISEVGPAKYVKIRLP